MNIFLSRYLNNIDKKGRVSVPASYRSILSELDFKGVVLYPSFRNASIEACSLQRLEHLSKIIDSLDPYSQERDAFETIMLGEAVQLNFDGEGRIIIPKELLQYADISTQACFIGKGTIFEIWNPEKLKTHLSCSREIAQNNRLTLKNI